MTLQNAHCPVGTPNCRRLSTRLPAATQTAVDSAVKSAIVTKAGGGITATDISCTLDDLGANDLKDDCEITSASGLTVLRQAETALGAALNDGSLVTAVQDGVRPVAGINDQTTVVIQEIVLSG